MAHISILDHFGVYPFYHIKEIGMVCQAYHRFAPVEIAMKRHPFDQGLQVPTRDMGHGTPVWDAQAASGFDGVGRLSPQVVKSMQC